MALVLACGACSSHGDTKRQLRKVIALDDGSALVGWRDQANQEWIGRTLPGSLEFRWKSRIVGEHQLMEPDDGTLLASGVFGVRTIANRGTQEPRALYEGFDLEHGTRRWTVELGSLPAGASWMDGIPPHGAGRVVSGRMYVLFEEAGQQWLNVVDPHSGLVHRSDLGVFDARAPLVLGSSLIVHAFDRAIWTDGAVASAIPVDGTGCVVDDEYWHLTAFSTLTSAPAGTARQLAIRTDPRSHPRELTLPVAAPEGQRVSLVGCARHGERSVLYLRFTGSRARDTVQLRMLDAQGQSNARVDLGELEYRGSPVDEVPEATAMSGALPRYVPFLVREGEGKALVMVDLELGKIAWRTSRPLAAERVFRSQRRWYLLADLGRLIAVLDGDTGSLEAAVRIRAVRMGQEQLAPVHVSAAGVWLFNSGWWPGSKVDAVRLDPVTLDVLGNGGASFSVTRAEDDPGLHGIPSNGAKAGRQR